MIRDPNKLQVFPLAHGLALAVYRLTASLPVQERYGLAAQLRRAAVSVPTNIVEGCARSSAREYQRFLEVAAGSASEVRYLLRLVVDLNLLSADATAECRECSDRITRTLKNLQRAVQAFRA
jgi:four helix bundle protein